MAPTGDGSRIGDGGEIGGSAKAEESAEDEGGEGKGNTFHVWIREPGYGPSREPVTKPVAGRGSQAGEVLVWILDERSAC